MKKFITTVKGISASGKSSRTLMCINFLKNQGFKCEKLSFTNENGKTKEIGFLFPELDNLVFIGTTFDYHGVEKFQGFDAMTSQFVSAQGFSDYLKANIDTYSFVIEGAGVTGTNRLRPKFLYEYVGCKNLLMQYYNFREDEKDLYMERVFYRSGKYPGDQMWSKCRMFNVEVDKSIAENEEIQKQIEWASGVIDEFSFAIFGDYSQAPIWDLGIKLFELYPQVDLKQFIPFCDSLDYTNKNKFIA